MHCACGAPALTVSHYPGADRAVPLCASCRGTHARRGLAALVEPLGRTHTAALLRGERCAGVCAACDVSAREEWR
jgi:hypothetical protein